MKKILLIVLLLPILSFAQSLDSLIVIDLGFGLAKDLSYTNKDVNDYSPDMSSYFDNEKVLKNGVEFNIAYKLNKKCLVGFDFLNSSIYGYNNVEYFEGKFNEKNFFIEYDILNFKMIDAFLNASTGLVDYEAKRFLLLDDTELSINSPNGRDFKSAVAFGLKLNFINDIQLIFKYNFTRIYDDGFDGWDYGTDVDLYSFRSVNLRLPLSSLYRKK